jgi:hypothetical protein
MAKNILSSSVLILVGIVIGAAMVYGYLYNFNFGKFQKASLGGTPEKILQKTQAEADCLAYLKFKEIKASILPSGSPEYGSKLNVSYDQADKAVNILARLEGEIGFQNLTKEEKSRYIKIATTQGTACEFCCGLKTSFGNEEGQRLCGCAHNIAFSGLTMWMIKNGYKNEEILTEIGRWKALYFPKQTLTKKLQELEKAGEEGIKEILEEFPEFLPQMVGGC